MTSNISVKNSNSVKAPIRKFTKSGVDQPAKYSLSKRCLDKIDISSLSSADKDNLRNEIRLHSALRHPNIINFIDCFQIENTVFYLLEHAENGSLFPFIDPKSGLPESLALRFVYQTATGLHYLHQRNIVHRDIKPENLLLDESFNIKICDFGWSAEFTEKQVRNSLCGTFEYMAPEVLNRETHGPKIDAWCLGVLLYELLHGRSPFEGRTLDQVKSRVNLRRITVKAGLSPEVVHLIYQLLNFDSENRITPEQMLKLPFFYQRQRVYTTPISRADFGVLVKNSQLMEFAKLLSIKPYRETGKGAVMYFKQLPNGALTQTSFPKSIDRIMLERHLKAQATKTETQRSKFLRRSISCTIDNRGVFADRKGNFWPVTAIKSEQKSHRKNIVSNYSFNSSFLSKSRKNTPSKAYSEAKVTRLQLKPFSTSFVHQTIYAENISAFEVVWDAFANRFDLHATGRLVCLAYKVNWQPAFYFIERELGLTEEVLFVTYFDTSFKAFVIETIACEESQKFVRRLINRQFRGKSQTQLQTLTNLQEFVFCHVTGVRAAASTLRAAVRIMELSL